MVQALPDQHALPQQVPQHAPRNGATQNEPVPQNDATQNEPVPRGAVAVQEVAQAPRGAVAVQEVAQAPRGAALAHDDLQKPGKHFVPFHNKFCVACDENDAFY